jgi:hypothetical protein
MVYHHLEKSTLSSRKSPEGHDLFRANKFRAGGGGNKRDRHAKIGEKNQKLNEERIRRIHEEDKAKLVKKDLAIDHNDVHPSRRARVPDIS